MYQLSDYDYDLPQELIAQEPCADRSASRLLHIKKLTETLTHHRFSDLASLLKEDDLLVMNNTKVVPARLFGKKETGGQVEILIIDYARGMQQLEETGMFQCDCLLKASKSPKEGAVLELPDGVQAEVVKRKGYLSTVRFLNGEAFPDYLMSNGKMPLPPYIKRESKAPDGQDSENYQTVYAQNKGAVAAPTAGLHFTQDLLETLEKKGIRTAFVTLHVGYGTFVPVRVDDIREHQIHSEYFVLPQKTADMINEAKAAGRRVVAVGTTSVRTLEFCADENQQVKATSGQCNLYIYPGYQFKCVDAMITNFHLPESTLLMLVSAFYEREKILDAYRVAVEEGYRFFSYGDAMLIE